MKKKSKAPVVIDVVAVVAVVAAGGFWAKGDSDSTGAICGNLSQNVSCLFLLSYNVLQIILHGCSLIIGIYDIL